MENSIRTLVLQIKVKFDETGIIAFAPTIEMKKIFSPYFSSKVSHFILHFYLYFIFSMNLCLFMYENALYVYTTHYMYPTYSNDREHFLEKEIT